MRCDLIRMSLRCDAFHQMHFNKGSFWQAMDLHDKLKSTSSVEGLNWWWEYVLAAML
jgi:hypothetical protein